MVVTAVISCKKLFEYTVEFINDKSRYEELNDSAKSGADRTKVVTVDSSNSSLDKRL